MPLTPRIDTPDAFESVFGVSRETLDKLKTYELLLKRWQKTINLVAPSTLDDIWHRHFADSAQLGHLGRDPLSPWGEGRGEGAVLLPATITYPSSGLRPTSPQGEKEKAASPAATWLDLGSGAGFPGLVLAILGSETQKTRHVLVESDSRKAAFLREVARETGTIVDILCTRIENSETHARVREINCITARALAPLPRLFGLVAPYVTSSTVGLFLKGREVAAEIEEAARDWQFDYELQPSLTDDDSRVVLLKALKPKA